jgi:hypothetical protein
LPCACGALNGSYNWVPWRPFMSMPGGMGSRGRVP